MYFQTGDFQLHDDNEQMFILCKDACSLHHEEYKSILIPEGLYKKGIVLEYDHLLEEARNVID